MTKLTEDDEQVISRTGVTRADFIATRQKEQAETMKRRVAGMGYPEAVARRRVAELVAEGTLPRGQVSEAYAVDMAMRFSAGFERWASDRRRRLTR